MSAIFNGSSGYLHLASSVLGSTPTHPVMFGGWFKFTNVTADNTLLFVGDNAALPSIDYQALYALGSVASDPIRIQTAAAGSGNQSNANFNGFTSGSWLFVWGLFTADNSRYCGIGTSGGTPVGTTRAVTGLANTTIGVQYWQTATQGAFLNGRGAEVFIASGDASITTNITTILAQLAAGIRPIHCPLLSPFVNLYQPLVAGVNESTKVGSDMTANSMTYDGADHPALIFPPWFSRRRNP